MTRLRHELPSRVLYSAPKGKQYEVEALKAILLRLGLGHYSIIEGERPDLSVSFCSGAARVVIACEVTAFHSDSTADAHGSAGARRFEKWRSIAELARRELDSKGLQTTWGVVSFREPADQMLDAVVPELFVSEIVDVCLQTRADQGIDFPVNGYPHLSALVERVACLRYPETGLLWWAAHLQSGLLADPTEELVRIAKVKTAKAKSYDWGSVIERWLLIIAAARHLTDTALLREDPRLSERLQVVGFDRVILWDRLMDELIQLFPLFTKLCDSSRQTRQLKAYPEHLAPFVTADSTYPTKPRLRWAHDKSGLSPAPGQTP